MLKRWLIKVSALVKKIFDFFINLMKSGGRWAFQSSLFIYAEGKGNCRRVEGCLRRIRCQKNKVPFEVKILGIATYIQTSSLGRTSRILSLASSGI